MELGGKLEILERLGRLYADGAITDGEFAVAKAKVLGSPLGSQAHPTDDHIGTLPLEAEQTIHFGVPSPYDGDPRSKWIGGAIALLLVAGAGFWLMLSNAELPTPAPPSERRSGVAEAARVPEPETRNAAEATDEALNASSSPVAAVSADANVSANQTSDAVAVESSSETRPPAETSSNSRQETIAAEERLPKVLSTSEKLPAGGGKVHCSLSVGGRDYISGDCNYWPESDGSFKLISLDRKMAAQVIPTSAGEAGYWNGEKGGLGLDYQLGPVTRSGMCWSNTTAKICAWRG